MSLNNSLLNNYKEKEYFLLKAVSQNPQWIALCSVFLIFISLLVFPAPTTASQQRRHTGKNTGPGVNRSRCRPHFTIYSFCSLGSMNKCACYMRSLLWKFCVNHVYSYVRHSPVTLWSLEPRGSENDFTTPYYTQQHGKGWWAEEAGLWATWINSRLFHFLALTPLRMPFTHLYNEKINRSSKAPYIHFYK